MLSIAKTTILSHEKTTGSRLHEVDFLRASAIILVILYHTYRIFDLEAFNIEENRALFCVKWILDHVIAFFRMPLLIFVSGYMFAFLKLKKGKYEDSKRLIKQKFKRLLLPYFVFAPITYICYNLWKSDAIESYLCPIGHLWFIVMLFWCFSITQILSKILDLRIFKNFVPIFIILILCYPLSFALKDYLGLASCLKWLWCFILGFGCYSLPKSEYLRNLSLKNISLMMVCSLIGIAGISVVSDLNMKMAIILQPYVMAICVLTAWGGVFYVGIKNVSPLFSHIINCSYGMYVVHMWILSIIFYNAEAISRYVGGNLTIFSLILFISVTAMSIIFSIVILRTRIGKYLIG